MFKKVFIFICLLTVLLGGGLYFSKQSAAPSNFSSSRLFQDIAEKVPREENLPEPLQRLGQAATGKHAPEDLNPGVIISLTNQERAQLDRKPLKQNKLLTKAAQQKLSDMFDQQYFEHISPDGRGPADVVTSVGYAYILVGENLAQGDFRSNADLLQGWMNSPGHRANIINPKYTEIGVAVGKGTYQGTVVWMAVQEFGRPTSDCPEVDENLKAQIDQNESQIKAWQNELANLNTQLSTAKNRNDTQTYNSLVPLYNELVNRTNELINATKTIVAAYNTQVQSYNACIK